MKSFIIIELNQMLKNYGCYGIKESLKLKSLIEQMQIILVLKSQFIIIS